MARIKFGLSGVLGTMAVVLLTLLPVSGLAEQVPIVADDGLVIVISGGNTDKGIGDSHRLKPYDILFSNRFSQGIEKDKTSFDKSKEFGATALVWHYPRWSLSPVDSHHALLAKAHNQHTQCALPLPVEDPNEACRDVNGQIVDSFFGWVPDVFSPVLKQKRLGQVAAGLEVGCDSFQQDLAILSVYARVGLNRACYSPEADQAFQDFIRNRLQSDQLRPLGNISTFNYSSYVRSGNSSLQNVYEEFTKLEVLKFYRDLKTHASDITNQRHSFSGNLFSSLQRYSWLLSELDTATTELSEEQAHPLHIVRNILFMENLNRSLIYTLASRDLWLNRKVFALTYALGQQMILPWDVFVPPDDPADPFGAPRLFLEPEKIGDLTNLISSHQTLFEETELTGIYGWMERSFVTFSGVENGRVRVSHSLQSRQTVVPVGTQFTIGGRNYVTTVKSTVGHIYLAKGAENEISPGMIVEKVVLPDHSGQVFHRRIAPLVPRVMKVEVRSSKAYVYLDNQDGLGPISQYSRVLIDGRRFDILEFNPNGVLVLNSRDLESHVVGGLVYWLENPGGHSFNFSARKNAPRVTDVIDYDGSLAIRVDSGIDKNIPTGSRFWFAGGILNIQRPSGIGNIYAETQDRLRIFKDMPLTRALYTDGRHFDFRRPLFLSSAIDVKAPRYFVITRTDKRTGENIFHLVDWYVSRRPVTLEIDRNLLTGSPQELTLYEGFRRPVTIPVQYVDANRVRIDLPGIAAWAILR